jgi:hypothetical protein
VCVVYTTVFEYKNQVVFNVMFLTVGLVVVLTLAFGIQIKTSFLDYEKQVIFQYGAF